MSVDDLPRNPVPARLELQQFLSALADEAEEGGVSSEYLVALLAQARQASRDLGWVSDWVLTASRENGATLPALAEAWSASGNRLYVRGPDERLKKLHDRRGDSADILALFLALPVEDEDSSNNQ